MTSEAGHGPLASDEEVERLARLLHDADFSWAGQSRLDEQWPLLTERGETKYHRMARAAHAARREREGALEAENERLRSRLEYYAHRRHRHCMSVQLGTTYAECEYSYECGMNTAALARAPGGRAGA